MSSTIEITKICDHCGNQFIARKCSTRFCSKRCAEHAYKATKRKEHVKREQLKADNHINSDLKSLEFLSPAQCAKLLGVCKRSIYYYLEYNLIPCYQFKGKTRIRRADIEKLFDKNPEYIKRPPKETNPITEFYSTIEIIEKFNISNSWLFRIAQKRNIPKTTHRGKTLWSKKHCDEIFGKKDQEVEEITEWYSASDVCDKFNMSLSQVYNLVNREHIPKKKVGNITSYSKKHIDIAKGVRELEEPEWYSLAEAKEKYGMTRDQLYHYAKTYGITKKKVGKYTYLSRKELDNLFAPPQI